LCGWLLATLIILVVVVVVAEDSVRLAGAGIIPEMTYYVSGGTEDLVIYFYIIRLSGGTLNSNHSLSYLQALATHACGQPAPL